MPTVEKLGGHRVVKAFQIDGEAGVFFCADTNAQVFNTCIRCICWTAEATVWV